MSRTIVHLHQALPFRVLVLIGTVPKTIEETSKKTKTTTPTTIHKSAIKINYFYSFLPCTSHQRHQPQKLLCDANIPPNPSTLPISFLCGPVPPTTLIVEHYIPSHNTHRCPPTCKLTRSDGPFKSVLSQTTLRS